MSDDALLLCGTSVGLALMLAAMRMSISGTWRTWFIATTGVIGFVLGFGCMALFLIDLFAETRQLLNAPSPPVVLDTHTYTDSGGERIECATRNGRIVNCWD